MATTGTWAYNPAASNLVLTAYGRVGIRRAEITAQHMADAENEANLVQVMLSNRQPNLWTSELITQALTSGTASYDLPERTIAFQAVYLTTTSGGVSTDRIMWPYSAFEYSAIPDKTQEGPPTAYWYNRTSTPEIKLWPVPDDSATYTLKMRAVTQIEDVSLKSGANLQLPFRWLDVFVAELAYRLAVLYAPPREAARRADADRAWADAAREDQERVPIYLSLGSITTYYS